MGCCESSQNGSGSSSSPVSSEESTVFEQILSSIPAHCRKHLRSLPIRRFLDVYEFHLAAMCHVIRKEYLLAASSEIIAIQELKLMLPRHKDHFIFADMYRVLCACYFEIGNLERAGEVGEIIVAIMLKHTPIDYTYISLQYYRLSEAYMVREKWQKTEEYIVKAIEIGRFSNELPPTFIQGLEACLVMVRQNMIDGPLLQPIVHYLQSNPGESAYGFIRRGTAEMLPIYNETGLLEIDKTEYTRLPDKQTESQINDEILNDVLQSLEKYLKEDTFLSKYGTNGGSVSFIAAYFKATQMKTSSLSPVIIEAALTIIIERINNENMTDGERFVVVKQSPFTISYTDDDESRMKGVRVFQVKGRNSPEDNRIIVSLN